MSFPGSWCATLAVAAIGLTLAWLPALATGGAHRPGVKPRDLPLTALNLPVPLPEPQHVSYGIRYPQSGTRPRGIVVIESGGGWIPAHSSLLRVQLDRYSSEGFIAVAPDFGCCMHALADSIATVERMHARYGPDVPIFIWGGSTGGNLSLLVTEDLPYVAGAIDDAGPVDLISTGAPGLRRVSLALFTASGLDEMSPARHSELLGDRPIYAAYALNDQVIPMQQFMELLNRDPHITPFVLRPGPHGWVHSLVRSQDYTDWLAREANFLSLAVDRFHRLRAAAGSAYTRCLRRAVRDRVTGGRPPVCQPATDAELAGIPAPRARSRR
jgi:hypothetical protein